MEGLQTLPPELLVWVFESLDNIDDALHLARCCKNFYSIFNPATVRLKVFRSILAHGSHHENDLHLCQAVGMHAQFSAEFYSSPVIPENSERRRYYAGVMKPPERGIEIPANIVWDIVCRWHGLRLLFDLYCDEAVSSDYVRSVFSYSSGTATSDTTDISAHEPDLPKPFETLNHGTHELDYSQRKHAYQRFYSALTSQWLSVELLWQTRSQVWSTASDFNHAFERILKRWTHNPGKSLQTKIDTVEVVDFVWGYLGQKSFHVSSVPSWIENEGDDVTDQYLDDDESEIGNWDFFVKAVLQFLRPPQIIELVLSQWYPSEWRTDRPAFLRCLGLFDTWEGILVDREEVSIVDSWVPMNSVEDDVGHSLKWITGVDAMNEWWERYREEYWPSEIRGKAFFRISVSQDILGRVFSTQTLSTR